LQCAAIAMKKIATIVIVLAILSRSTVEAQSCSGSLGTPLIKIDFGSGATNPGPQLGLAVPGASTNYPFDPNATGNPPNIILDGLYALVNAVPQNNGWFTGATDHTGNSNGYMAFFNAAATPGEFYRQNVTGLCAGTSYQFAVWIANVIKNSIFPNGSLPNITLQIVNPLTDAVLASANTGNIANSETMTWKQYSLLFTVPTGSTTITLVLRNNNAGGANLPGNDLVMDDISFSPCGPLTQASFANEVINDSIVTNGCSQLQLFGKTTGTLNNPAYQWQVSTDTGRNFIDIPGATQLNPTLSNTASGLYQYRLLAAEGSNISSPTCRFLSNTIILLVTGCNNTTGNGCPNGIDFTQEQKPCYPLEIKFTPSISNGITWIMPGNDTLANTPKPSYIFADTGLYTIQLIAQLPDCTDTIKKDIAVQLLRAALIGIADTTVCKGNSLVLQSVLDSTSSFCWSPATYLNNTLLPAPESKPEADISYTLHRLQTGSNLLQNGNFNAGNTGFGSNYNFSTGNPLLASPGEYAIVSSGFNPACTDHTGGGNMLLVRTNTLTHAAIWQQTVTVTPNTNYQLSTWLQLQQTAINVQFQFAINGNAIGDTIRAGATTCEWNKYNLYWNSGNATNITIGLYNKNSIAGNHFVAFDDFLLQPYWFEEDGVRINVDSSRVVANNDTAACRGTQIKLAATGAQLYEWSPAIAISGSNTPNPIVSPAQSTLYTVAGTSTNGCVSTDSLLFTVLPSPNITITADSSICINTSAALFAAGASSYSWSPASSLTNSTVANPIASPPSNTVYYVVSTDSNFSCTSTDSVKLTIRQPARFAVTTPDTLCALRPLNLLATGGNKYAWLPAHLLNDATLANPVAITSTNTLFTVTIKDTVCNDSSILTSNVVVKPLPQLRVRRSNNIDCYDLNATLTATGADEYIWTANRQPLYLNDSTKAAPLAFPSATTKYFVTGTDTLSGCSNTDSVTLLVFIGANPEFWVPNSFSPNNDGLNDCFKPLPRSRVKYYELSVYNRVGNRVFVTNNINDCWDGRYKGQPQDAGNFVYVIKVSNDCIADSYKGNLLLLR
jgi:gliding motility-associated-like protein